MWNPRSNVIVLEVWYWCLDIYRSSYDEEAVNVWVNSSVAPALPASLRLYKEVQESGVKIFLLTGRYEKQRNITLNNLLSAGYSGWEKLFMRYVYLFIRISIELHYIF